MPKKKISQVAQQAGFGLAGFLILTSLLDKLADKGVITRDELKELMEHSLLNAETHQTNAPHEDLVIAARTMIEALLIASDAKRRRMQNPRPT